MAIDGSFRLEFELERFLCRCPKLRSKPHFDFLLKKGDKITAEDVVNATAELFLHPNYTIPLIGCFRPIAQNIVEKAVELLRLVPNLSSNSCDYSILESEEDKFLREAEDFDGADVAHIVEVYVRCGKGLNLHEHACLAFSRALDLIPFLLERVLVYFKFAPPPYQRIILGESVSQGGKRLLNVVRASYRFLLAEPEVFATLWNWSCFLDVVQQTVTRHSSSDLDMPGVENDFLSNVSDIRWCAIRILSVVLKLSDAAFAQSSLGPEEDLSCLLRWQEFCGDVVNEKAGWYLEPSLGKNLVSTSEKQWQLSQSSDLGLSNLSSPISCEILPLHQSLKQVTWDARNPFVLTSNLKKSYEMAFLAVTQRWPVLLYGPAGAGKTALINKLAQDQGSRVLCIHMDDQIDGKTLLGSYVCTDQPGEFRWQPGSLTQAVKNGIWVVFEDVDKAPPDVQSIILPLLEGTTSFLIGNGEAIRVHQGFRLFSTVTSSTPNTCYAAEAGRSLLGAVWRKVIIELPSNEDLQNIVKAWCPQLESLSLKLIETFERVNEVAAYHSSDNASLSYNRRFSLRDLLKWCKRIVGFGFPFSGDGLSAYECDCISKEAMDIFAAFSTSAENRLVIMQEIAKMWRVPVPETLYPVNKPIVKELRSELCIGRVTLQRTKMASRLKTKKFVEIRTSVHVLERIACSIKYCEPVLLVGETGTGKTTLVQSLATRLGQKLTVLNLSQQSDVADLVGGFKPIDAQFVCIPLYTEFKNLFTKTFSLKDNENFLARLGKLVSDKNWKMLLNYCQKGVRKVNEIGGAASGTKRKRPLGEALVKAWENFDLKLKRALMQMNSLDGMIFSFIEGAFVSALKNGEWILLDEVNLAPPETLQRIIGVLEEENGSLCLAERGDVECIHRDPNFRIFACMNPATDAGKKDLPFSLRSRFTEYFVDDVLDDEDLVLFISNFIDVDHSKELVNQIVQFYKAAKKESEDRLQDGANQKPQYSLRSLFRAIEYTLKAQKTFGFPKALYDGFCMFFLTLLDEPSAKLMNQLISSYLLGRKIPQLDPFDAYLVVEGNSRASHLSESYVLTPSVREQLRNLARAIFMSRYPVLLQGPTSSGKTSLVQYLAAITGHEFIRINNHEHTDLQEYLGTYITDVKGKLVFHEGALVKAVRNGCWIVLDELNLAPSDVLEALNRLLDDNRELFVPELCETIRAHPGFMLFATQNPPTFYGGRKMLSRAFRNRFVEIHVDEIPRDELYMILEKRCQIPGSYAKKMVDVMKELQLHRQTSKIFAGKHGFITPRDLFRWADRFRTFGKSYEDLARDGYYLMAERLRIDGEKKVVQEVLEKQLRVKLSQSDMYKQEQGGGDWDMKACKDVGVSETLGIIWTKSMQRLYFLVERCFKLREPVLLVGETGGGKTSVCQLLSTILGSKLHILNCHQYTETSDFIGGFYPVRERAKITSDYKGSCERVLQSKGFMLLAADATLSSDIGQASATIIKLSTIISGYRQGSIHHPEVTVEEVDRLERMCQDLSELHQRWQTIFSWQDGPLVEAMKKGELFLVDEISLADDSVLERLNSVLESERKLSLAEKGGSDLEKITAHPDFFVMATMNPGGDYGKKELSPALRNRFTEIWVPSVTDFEELKSIAVRKISRELAGFVDLILNFWEWFNHLQTGRMLTVRDLLSWITFINVAERSLQPESAFLHGAFLVLLDGLSLGTNISKSEAAHLRQRCLAFLLEQLKRHNDSWDYSTLSNLDYYGWAEPQKFEAVSCTEDMEHDNLFGFYPFYIKKGDDFIDSKGFEFLAPTTRRNALRVLRAMQLPKPVLLEGSPGVGKTSLVAALGRFSGHTVVRINLSEQTDMMDLLGSDLPVESEEGMQFAWSDGILLQALKKGSWVLLDELNLAPQSVLEGLNAILDHRAEVFIPELGLTFKCPKSFRVFACQNPSHQGGGRKGLPKSFLNRFTKVYVDELVEDDYLSICVSLYPSIEREILSKLILFNKRLHEDTMLYKKYAQDGAPWEFNLRDVIRSCQIIQGAPEKLKSDCFLNTVYLQRMRTPADRKQVMQLYEDIFGMKPFINPYPQVRLNPHHLIVGNISIKRNNYGSNAMSSNELKLLPGLRNSLEAAAHCVKQQWLCILIGPPSSGKTSLIRMLAQLSGNILNELNLSSATDISELLGCFEQHNASRNFHLAIAQVERYINAYCSLQLESSTDAFLRRRDLIARWFDFSSQISRDPSASMRHLPSLVKITEDLRLYILEDMLQVSWSCEDLDSILKRIRGLEEDHVKGRYSAKFEWLTGPLIKAIENGEWIVLENANLCNPTVLDRINSLVEQSGSITVNECGTVDGEPLVLHPHPQFRMFLTVNPSHGEVSRAMRNRGVEICMMEPHWLLDASSRNIDETEVEDAKRFIVLSGIPVDKLVDSMAKAHVCAKREGAQYNVNITYLELARWVQLFLRLLTNGNRPTWSIQISWEHTYLSSLGNGKGKDIVKHIMASILSISELCKLDSSQCWSLCLPGGWPKPFHLKDLVYYSTETSVRQNCMYLESLGAQNASYSYSSALRKCSTRQGVAIYLMDIRRLHCMMLPNASEDIAINFGDRRSLDLNLTKQMLLFAADWTIEQAVESDLRLYILWFRWFASQLQPYDSFFGWFSANFEKELEHPIWNRIYHCRQEIISCSSVNVDLASIPMLSPDFVDLFASVDVMKSSGQLLKNCVKCVPLLRRTYEQWSYEAVYNFCERRQCFRPVLTSLQKLEEKLLDLLPVSTSSILFRLYSDLLEHHTIFWDGIVSASFECLLISWRSLMKAASKLGELCPVEAENFQKEMMNLGTVSYWRFRLCKSLLWAHGGHPTLPSSADLFEKQFQLLNLCEMFWPRKARFSGPAGVDVPIEAALSSNSELRSLIMEGVCMSSYVMDNAEENDSHIDRQLEEIYQMLVQRFDIEKRKLEEILGTGKASWQMDLSACCIFPHNIFQRRSGFTSWLETLPIIDNSSFFLDMGLLHELTKISSVDVMDRDALSDLSGPMNLALDFFLKFSSRPPTDFIPHRNILWTVDAWTSVPAVKEKISGLIQEMWFKWHSFLWMNFSIPSENLSENDTYSIVLPKRLFQPMIAASIQQILQSTLPVEDYPLQSLKLRVASHNLWEASSDETNINSFLLTAARSFFQQIIYAHKKSLEDDTYARIKSLFDSSMGRTIVENDVEVMVSILASSKHFQFTSLIGSFIEPLIKELYLHCHTDDLVHKLGCAWLRIGGLRYCLLICCDNLDPTKKTSFKHSKVVRKIASIELENKVRDTCVQLAGTLLVGDSNGHRTELLQDLRSMQKRLQRKIVFRPVPGKFMKLKYECDEFKNEFVNHVISWIDDFEGTPFERIMDQMKNWQETATCFIERLSNEYFDYMDIVQPVIIAIYEMKLGLSLILSSALHKRFLEPLGVKDVTSLLDTIYIFMRFPRGCASKAISIKLDNMEAKVTSGSIDLPTSIGAAELELLQNLVGLTRGVNADTTMSARHVQTAIYLNVLRQVMHSISEARLLDHASFMLLDKIFEELANRWMDMKLKGKTEKENETQQFLFRPRTFRIENIIEVDISNLRSVVSSEILSEWQELLCEEDFSEKTKDDAKFKTEEEDWSGVDNCILNEVVHIHNQLFGSEDLIQNPGFLRVPDSDRLSAFVDSYSLGITMINDIEGLPSSCFDAKIIPEHLLRLCLEHRSYMSPCTSTKAYNFYKDSNPPMMAKLVDPLCTLKRRVIVLLNEWDDHPALRKILDVIEMILALPLSTPLAKTLSGLQLLLSRVRLLQETVAKFPLSDQLEPIYAVVSSWHKLETESWPVLIDEVQDQLETNAGKLWFPLYSVLRLRRSDHIDDYTQSTVQSLQEFIQTSSIGEFRRRLQLLLAFYGHFSNGLSRGNHSSACQMENVKILFNTFGFNVQFLPIIMEHIRASKASIEMDVKDLLKLCRWERVENYLTVENSRRTRQKLRKIMQKYTDLLQQPVMLFLTQEASRRGLNTQIMQRPNRSLDSFEKSSDLLDVICCQTQLKDKDRSLWFVKWWQKVELVLPSLRLSSIEPYLSEVTSTFKDAVSLSSSCLSYLEDKKQMWHTVEKICRILLDCCEVWKGEGKGSRKRRIFSDLLKLFDSTGLSKHRSIFIEDQSKIAKSSFWLHQPSYDVQHLMLTQGQLSPSNSDVAAKGHLGSSPSGSLDTEWRTANQFYFKSISSFHVLQEICLNFDKDFTLDQVRRSGSYVDHLIVILQEQRTAAYKFSRQLKCLRDCVWPLANLFSSSTDLSTVTGIGSSFTHNQHITFKCMWLQKQLLDSLCATLYDECLLLKTVEDNHLCTCTSLRNVATQLRSFIEKHAPDFQRSKDLLDSYLLGCNSVIVDVATLLHPYGVTKQMEELVVQNFQMIKAFESDLRAICSKDRAMVKRVLLGHFEDLFQKASIISKEFDDALGSKNSPVGMLEVSRGDRGNVAELEAGYADSLKSTYECVARVFHNLGSLNSCNVVPKESLENISLWRDMFESDVACFQLDLMCDKLLKTIHFAGELLICYGDTRPSKWYSIGENLKNLYSLLDEIIAFGDVLLHDFLVMHKLLSIMTHVLADVFASLFAKGFGTKESKADDSNHDLSQDASGTGMGEGAGLNDVSDQLSDEDQLFPASANPNEEKDASNDVPSKDDRGIEMEQDFLADTYSVSEDSGDDENEDNEDENLESAMGETGVNSEVVNEKFGDKDDEEAPDNADEKYETGPSVKDKSLNDRQILAKEDSAADIDDSEEPRADEVDDQRDENGTENFPDTMEEASANKEDAYLDPTGVKPDEPNEGSEDIDMDVSEAAEPIEDGEPENMDDSSDHKNHGSEETDLTDENMQSESEHLVDDSENTEVQNNSEGNDVEKNLAPQKKDVSQSLTSDSVNNDLPNGQSTRDIQIAEAGDIAPEANISDLSNDQNDLAPMRGLPNAPENEMGVADSSTGRKLSHDQLAKSDPLLDSSLQKNQPNPCRNLGDALEGWKERIKVSVDLEENNMDGDDVADENVDEYGYTTEIDKGTAQALGSATTDQIDANMKGKDLEGDPGLTGENNDVSEMELDNQPTEARPMSSAFSVGSDIKRLSETMDLDEEPNESADVYDSINDDFTMLSQSVVSINRSYMSKDVNQLSKLSMSNEDIENVHSFEELSISVRDDAAILWKRYELLTTRLSQELSEQLRLVMEPTLASKLQGDYKTGKRINMKKVIPYIASHYRKDKIWLRRTRPNKRDYQVVIAVDDSRSMSESHCGNFAIEALVTVCRAMSQLEVGKLAVTSFGKKGNIQLLHDFDRPFNGDAGIKMISGLTFKQENTIADEPMVDLLKYLDHMLDKAGLNARLPSGHNPLQQLVLIIADGRFHEKENLRRYVRDMLSKRRMIAFLLLDSPQESIVDLMEATFQDGNVSFSKYLDSFPFPYYVVLKNIEALPRTLSDLMRQWFELMQYSRD